MSKKLIKKQFNLFTQDSKNNVVEVYFYNENIWLSQKLMGILFDVDVKTINEHLKNIFNSGELQENSTIWKFQIVQTEGSREVNREISFYNLDAIISVGYRVNSKKATNFRIWATRHLKEFILKGYVLDDERLKQGQDLDKNYFKELLERIRSIRASERRIYQQITDIFAEVSIDYDKDSQTTRDFFSSIQNKFHFAITGQTSAEIIFDKANHSQKNMGLQTWSKEKILQSDALIAKNYLDEKQIKQLERTITGFFDYIEGLIEREKTFTMKKLQNSVNKFLDFQEYRILEGKGKISQKKAKEKAKKEYDIFNKKREFESDFDKATKKYLKEKN